MAASATATRPTRQRRSDKPAEPPPPDSAPASEPAAQPSDQTTGIPPMETMPADIVSAICSIRQEVGAVRKDGEYKQGGTHYNFRGVDAVVNALSPAMTRHGLVTVPVLVSRTFSDAGLTQRGAIQRHVAVEVDYIVMGPGGSVLPVNARVPGEAIDSSDKGTAKAMSVAYRIFLLQLFSLPTGDPDPDSERPEGTPLPTADEVTAQIKAALEAADPLAALEGIAAHHGDGNVSRGRNILSRVTLTRADGSQADADTIVGELYGKTQTELAQRVDQARAEQDAAAEGPARDVHDEQPVDESPAGPQPQAGQEAPPEPTPQPAQDTQPVQDAPPVEGNAQTTLRTLMFTEIKAQAAVLDVDPVQYVDPIVRSLGLGTINDVGQGHLGQLGTWMHRQRRHVISALNERGNGPAATAVAALTAQQVADEPTVLLMLGEDARQPEPARG